MKRISTLIAVLALCIAALASCSGDSAPSGLQTAHVSTDDGYIFYAPEKWTVTHRDGITLAYVSAINRTSVSFTKAELPSGSLDDYMQASISSLNNSEFTVKGEKCNFGNEGEAYKYIYTYDYGTEEKDGEQVPVQYTVMQILVKRGGDFFIFTYSAEGAPDDESASYSVHLSYVQAAIDGFSFTEKSESAIEEPVYETDADGYKLVSDKSLCGFSLYVPADYEVVDSSGIVSAKISDRANISLTEARETGVDIFTYWANRKADLERSVGAITEISVNKTNVKDEETGAYSDEVKLGSLERNSVASYEYTYVRGGVTYHVLQILGWNRDHGYVFTYTATEDEYQLHLIEVMSVISKLVF